MNSYSISNNYDNFNNIVTPSSIDIVSVLNNDKQEENILIVNNDDNVKNKNNNKQEYIFDDGIDTVDYKVHIRDILVDRRFLLVITFLIFIFVCILLVKVFYLGDKVDSYEEFFTVIEKREEEYAKVYEEREINNEVLKKVAASELINCINSTVDINKLPDSINNIIKEINDYYSQSNDYFAFKYKDIFTGFTVSYNENQQIFTSSTIKTPTDIYIYEMASMGKINLDEELTYTGSYYNTGSGVLKNKQINTKYNIKTLLEYSIVHSDNAAHNMLIDKYGRENMYNFWKEKGTNTIFSVNNNWGLTNAHDASIYMEKLYNFYIKDDKYSEVVMNNFMNARPKFILGKNNYVVANKSGWSGTAIYDVSIFFPITHIY